MKPEEDGGSVDVDSVDAPESKTPASNEQGSLFKNTTPSGPYLRGF
jgi:hypothetical protein